MVELSVEAMVWTLLSLCQCKIRLSTTVHHFSPRRRWMWLLKRKSTIWQRTCCTAGVIIMQQILWSVSKFSGFKVWTKNWVATVIQQLRFWCYVQQCYFINVKDGQHIILYCKIFVVRQSDSASRLGSSCIFTSSSLSSFSLRCEMGILSFLLHSGPLTGQLLLQCWYSLS